MIKEHPVNVLHPLIEGDVLMPGTSVYHDDDESSSGIIIALVTNKATVMWAKKPDHGFKREYAGLFGPAAHSNKSKYSEKVFNEALDRYGVILNEHVVDLRYHACSDGRMELEVVSDDYPRTEDHRWYGHRHEHTRSSVSSRFFKER